MEERPLVSIVVPVYNAERYIAETIRSIQAQTCANWEMLLVDDCSADQSATVIQPFLTDARITYVPLRQNAGAAKARNIGILKTHGAFVAFLDADDVWLPDKLERQLGFMQSTGAAFSFTSYAFGDEEAKNTGKLVHAPETLVYKEALSRTVIFTSTVMFHITEDKLSRRDILMPEVKSEDTATWWRILRSGYTAYGLDEVLTIYRRPARSLSSNKLEAIRRIWNLYRNMEGLGIFKSARYFILWAVRASLRRL